MQNNKNTDVSIIYAIFIFLLTVAFVVAGYYLGIEVRRWMN